MFVYVCPSGRPSVPAFRPSDCMPDCPCVYVCMTDCMYVRVCEPCMSCPPCMDCSLCTVWLGLGVCLCACTCVRVCVVCIYVCWPLDVFRGVGLFVLPCMIGMMTLCMSACVWVYLPNAMCICAPAYLHVCMFVCVYVLPICICVRVCLIDCLHAPIPCMCDWLYGCLSVRMSGRFVGCLHVWVCVPHVCIYA